MRKLVILAIAAVSLTVAACNTVEGAGKDVTSAGEAVSNTALRREETKAAPRPRASVGSPGLSDLSAAL